MNKSMFIALFLLLALTVYCYVYASSPKYFPSQKKALYLAHRGYSSLYPEGTSIAFLKAIEMNTDGLEFDVRQTKDGEIVVTHDDDINIASGEYKYIGDSTLKELKNIAINENQAILTLRETIKLSKQHQNIPIWPEIKESHKYPNILNKFITTIESEKYEAYTIMQSFNTQDLIKAHAINSKIKLLKLTFIASDSDINNLPSYVQYIGIPIAVGYTNSGLIKKIHDLGKKVIFWRESDLFESRRIINNLTENGADGFMINEPIELLK